MSLRASRPILLPEGMRGLNLLRHLPQFVRLYWRLLRDRRVSVWPKALLGIAIAYVLLPFDLIPDFLPVVGQVDDVIVFIGVCRLFIYLCPPAVVREHVLQLGAESR